MTRRPAISQQHVTCQSTTNVPANQEISQPNYLHRTGLIAGVTVTATLTTVAASPDVLLQGVVGGAVDDDVVGGVLVQAGHVGVIDHADHGHAQVDAKRVQVDEAQERHDGHGQPRRAP